MGREIISQRDIVYVRHYKVAGGEGSSIESSEPLATPDPYQDRLLKCIPAEAVAGFLTLNSIVPKTANGWATWFPFFLMLVLVPLYLKQLHGVNKIVQLTISTIAFAVWVFAIGGPFLTLEWYQPWLASLVLVTYTIVVPLIKP